MAAVNVPQQVYFLECPILTEAAVKKWFFATLKVKVALKTFLVHVGMATRGTSELVG